MLSEPALCRLAQAPLRGAQLSFAVAACRTYQRAGKGLSSQMNRSRTAT